MKIKVKLTREENISYYNKEIIEIDIEEYLKGVVPAEIGNAALEACKAQAVAARTFALNKFNQSGQITDKSSTHQAFRTSRFSSAYARAHQAVEETAGEVLYYNNKLVTNAHYCSSNGGRTYSSKEVWGGTREYLIAQKDPWDKKEKNSHGVGMSQTGAKYAASIGKTYKEILAFYYPGTEIVTLKQEETKGGKQNMLTNLDFVKFLIKAEGWPYWYGTCVYKCTNSTLNSKKKQYPSHYTSSRMSKYKSHVAKKLVAADCVGLGKGYNWTNGGETVFEAIGTDKKITSKYGKGCPDKSANGMFTYAKSKGLKWGTIDTIPEIPGLAVRYDGHVGYYIGNGEVIEERGFAYGCQRTKLKDRKWLHWYEFPGITYVSDSVAPEIEDEIEFGDRTLKRGMTGDDIKELQELLNELDYGPLTVDGDFGKKTEAAVKEYQKENKLDVDGVVGPDTFAELLEDQGEDKIQEPEPEEKVLDYSKCPTIRYKDENKYVSILQAHLVALGYDLGTWGEAKNGVDGEFGRKTRTAVRAFQKKYKLKVDGVVGPATWGELEKHPI